MNNEEGRVKEISKRGNLTAREIKEELRKRDISFVKSYDKPASIIFYLLAALWLLPAIAKYSGWVFLNFFARLPKVDFPIIVIVIGAIFFIAAILLDTKVMSLRKRLGGCNDTHESIVIVKKGLYKVIRHPGYLAELIWLPLIPIILSKWVPFTIFAIPGIVYIIGLMVYLIKVEDSFNIKKWGDEYREYMREVPAINFVKGSWNIAREQLLKQVRKPTGRFGRIIAKLMNYGHSKLTQWGLSHISINKEATILDIGCGGGKTANSLAKIATEGKIYGVDYSKDCVAVASKINKKFIDTGKVKILHASVESLPFPDDFFDLITVVETYYFFPDLINNLKEIHRVLKPKGSVILINEAYRGGRFEEKIAKWAKAGGFTFHLPEKFREFLIEAGYSSIQIDVLENKNWITIIGTKNKT